MKKTPAKDRFWNKVEKTETCWLWKGSVLRTKKGYGDFHADDQLKAL